MDRNTQIPDHPHQKQGGYCRSFIVIAAPADHEAVFQDGLVRREDPACPLMHDVQVRHKTQLFPGITVLGGLENRSGAIASGDPEQVRAAVRELVAREGRERLIVGADCTLATDQDRAVVRAAVEEARSL